MIKKVTILLISLIFLPKLLFANTQFFQEAINLYNNKKFDEAKFKFEQDIVFNPKMKYHICIYQKYLRI